MNDDEFKKVVYAQLLEKGYKTMKSSNGVAYTSNDVFFCPQAPSLFMLFISPKEIALQKAGKNGYFARLSSKVNSPEDINILHEEINRIIFHSDESSFVKKSSGCLIALLLFIANACALNFYITI